MYSYGFQETPVQYLYFRWAVQVYVLHLGCMALTRCRSNRAAGKRCFRRGGLGDVKPRVLCCVVLCWYDGTSRCGVTIGVVRYQDTSGAPSQTDKRGGNVAAAALKDEK